MHAGMPICMYVRCCQKFPGGLEFRERGLQGTFVVVPFFFFLNYCHSQKSVKREKKIGICEKVIINEYSKYITKPLTASQ